MGYREDGMFGFPDANASSNGQTNPRFTYPSRSIRFLEAQAALDGKPENYTIHRGYLRNLEQPALPGVPVSKCYFQFNPQEIRQSVAMREDVYLAVLQDPAQLAQPVGAQMNFQFDLLFDRSLEVASGAVYDTETRRNLIEGNRNRGTRNVTADINNPNPAEDVYDIGVMADLRVLYSVIGQGFSREMLQWQLASVKAAAQRVYDRDYGSVGASTDAATSEFVVDDLAAEAILQNNFGNSAFIMPNPVRVMFSSLFMLDGFITGTQVDFLKFNTNMVPLQCRVGITMSAMYIGFAKQDTFLTLQLTEAGRAVTAAAEQARDARNELAAALSKTGSLFGVRFSLEPIEEYVTDFSYWDKMINGDTPSDDTGDLYYYDKLSYYIVNDRAGVTGDSLFSHGRAVYYGFPQIIAKEGGDDVYEDDGTTRREGADVDEILALFQSDVNLSVSYNVNLNIYGEKPSTGQQGLTQEEATSYKNSGEYLTATGMKLLGSYSFSETASSDDEWGKGKSGDGVKPERIRRRTRHATYTNSKVPNTSADAFQVDPDDSLFVIPAQLDAAYYVVVLSVSVTATTSAGESLSRSAEKKMVLKGDAPIPAETFYIAWNGYGGSGGDAIRGYRTGDGPGFN